LEFLCGTTAQRMQCIFVVYHGAYMYNVASVYPTCTSCAFSAGVFILTHDSMLVLSTTFDGHTLAAAAAGIVGATRGSCSSFLMIKQCGGTWLAQGGFDWDVLSVDSVLVYALLVTIHD
jgi:hypothetical protein